MRIVIDTNIIASAVFFGGNPRKIIEALFEKSWKRLLLLKYWRSITKPSKNFRTNIRRNVYMFPLLRLQKHAA